MNNHILFIDKCGGDYQTMEGLQAANLEHMRQLYPKKVEIVLQPKPLPRNTIFLDQ